MYLWIIAFAVLIATMAFLWNEGFWNNALTFLNGIFAGIFATNYYEWMADLLNYKSSLMMSYLYTRAGAFVWDALCFWFLFGLAFALLRLTTDSLSRHKVRLSKPLEIAGNAGFSFAVGCLMVTYFLFVIHIAPLSRHPFGGAFQRTPASRNLLVGPDKIWLSLSNYWSWGSLSCLSQTNEFDPNHEFIVKYYWRRRVLEGREGFLIESGN